MSRQTEVAQRLKAALVMYGRPDLADRVEVRDHVVGVVWGEHGSTPADRDVVGKALDVLAEGPTVTRYSSGRMEGYDDAAWR